MMMDIDELTTEDIKESVDYIYQQILNSGWKPTKIVGIQLGGLTPALMLAKKFGMKTIDTIMMNGSYAMHYNLPVLDRKILLIDDIADSGTTFINVLREMIMMDTNAEYDIRTAAIVHKTHTSKHTPDFIGRATQAHSWIQFPWEWHDEVVD